MQNHTSTKEPSLRIQWLILGSSLLILGGFIAYNIYAEHARIDSTERGQLSAQAKVVEQNMVRQLSSINRALGGLRNDLISLSKHKDDTGRNVSHLKTIIDAIPGVRTILLTNAQGIITASNREKIIGLNALQRDYFQAPLRDPNPDTLYISPPFTTVLGIFSMSVTRAIIGADGRFAGVISATLAPEEFEVLMNSVRYAPDIWTFLAHGDGAVFMMAPERKELEGTNLARPGTFFTRHLESGQVANIFSGTVYLTGENRMVALRTIHPVNFPMDKSLVIAVSRDLPTIFASWRAHAYLQGGLFGVLTLLAISALFFYQRRQREYLAERQQFEQTLQESEQRYHFMFDNNPMPMWVFAEGSLSFLEVNTRAIEHYGFTRAEFGKMTLRDIKSAADIQELDRAVSDSPDGIISKETRHLRKDGSEIRVIISTMPMRYKSISARIVLIQDITEQRQIEEEKSWQMQNQQALLNAIQESTFLMKRNGTILLINEVGAQRFNLKPEDMIDKNIYTLLPPHVALTRKEKFEQVALSGKLGTMEDERAGRRFLSSIYPIFDARGTVTRFAVYAADVTQQRKQQAIDEMLSAINQEILQGLSLAEVLTAICRKMAVLFQLEAVWLGRKDADGSINMLGEAGAATDYIAHLKVNRVRWDDTPQGRGPSGSAIRFGQVQVFKVDDPRFQAWAKTALKNDLQSILAIPLVIRSDIYGVFTLYSSSPVLFDSSDLVRQMENIGKRISIALETAMDQQQIRLLSLALEAAGNGVIITDLQGKIQWSNPAFSRLCGYSKQELLGQTPRILKSGHQSPEYYQALWAAISKGENWSSETVERAKDGSLYTVSQSITPISNDGVLSHFIAIHEDITAQKLTQKRIEYMAHYDALTGLPNRALFYDRLKQALSQARRSQDGLALLYMDLDGFKKVNDTQGHQAGDLLLVEVAHRLSKCIRESDTVARLGGDEFTIILHETHKHKDVTGVAQKIIEAIALPFDLNGKEAHIGISIGIARYAEEASTEDALMKHADAAMYAAKSAGKNTYRIGSTKQH